MTIKLYTHTQGQGPDLVLIHGWAFNSDVWLSITPILSQQFRVTVIDLPGFGRSQLNIQSLGTDQYSLDFIIDSIEKVAPQQAYYCGWSLGGLIISAFALRFPTRVQQLIYLASTPQFIAENNWPGISMTVMNQFTKQLSIDYLQTIQRFVSLQCLHTSRKHHHQLQQLLLSQQPPHQQALQGGLQILRDTDFRQQLQLLTCPQHYIFGRLDTIVPAKTSEYLRHYAPQAQLTVIDKAAHAPFLSHPRDFLNIVDRIRNN